MIRLSFIALLSIITYSASAQLSDSISAVKLDMMIGQMIITGLGDIDQLDTKASIFKTLEEGKAGGLILFGKNLSVTNTESNLREIINYAQSVSGIPLFISIDEEGGRVNRLKSRYGFPKTVSAQYLGNVNSRDSTFFYAFQTARVLNKLGINMNFAPDVDVNINPENPVIGKMGRSYSADPAAVASHAGWFIDAHDSMNVCTVIKHFPGHGSSAADSHLGLADVSRSWRFEELLPYKALIDSGKVRAIMSAHIVNEVLDDSKVPATLSNKVISQVLRGFMKYDGIVISDDMQMKAISKEYGLKEAVKMAINAGVDILLFANNVPDYELVTADQLHEIIKELVENEDISVDRITQSYKRIIKLKSEMGLIITK